jgi:acylphosphatase
MNTAESTGHCRRRVFISGLVQDVWFRATTAKHAVHAGVRGWVRNLADGRVEAVLEGSAAAENEMVDFCSRGPEMARVDRIEVLEETPENLEGFRVR